MTTINIKIVGVEGDSVLVKYASENSAKPIDEYDPVAYQPKAMGYITLQEFIEGIKPSLLTMVDSRDAAEQSALDLNSWVDHESTHNVEPIEPTQTLTIPAPLPTQLINETPEVEL